MRQTDWKYTVDFFLFICMVGIIGIGLLMAFVLAEGPVSDESTKYLFGLHRHQWGDIHLYLSLAFTAFLIVHLVLEWSWIKAKSQRIFRAAWRPVLISFIPLSIGIVGVFCLLSPKNAAEYRRYGTGAGPVPGQPAGGSTEKRGFLAQAEQVVVTGQTTLGELERSTGIPGSTIARAVGLPDGVPSDMPFGRLCKDQGFALEDLRVRLSELLEEDQELESPPPGQEERAPSQGQEHIDRWMPPVSGRQEADQSALVVTGQMSLQDIEAATGIEARRLAVRLGLPADVPLDSRLGHLRRVYGVSLPELRGTVSEMLEKQQKRNR